jgi:hypothetical protein
MKPETMTIEDALKLDKTKPTTLEEAVEKYETSFAMLTDVAVRLYVKGLAQDMKLDILKNELVVLGNELAELKKMKGAKNGRHG